MSCAAAPAWVGDVRYLPCIKLESNLIFPWLAAPVSVKTTTAKNRKVNMLDCRKMACPAPVIQTKDLVEADGPSVVEVLVDNQAASQNVSRFLEARGYSATVAKRNGDFLVTGQLGEGGVAEAPAAPEMVSCAIDSPKILVFVGSDRLGQGDDKLGAGLMKNFLLTLKEMGSDLWRLIFVNNGVKLCIEGAETLATLQELEKSGVSILVCGTCLTFFDLLEQKRVGETTNMLDVVTSLQLAGKVIKV